jgi:hypothetical protein
LTLGQIKANGVESGDTQATIVLEKIDACGRPIWQIELCAQHAQMVIARERARGLEISDRREQMASPARPPICPSLTALLTQFMGLSHVAALALEADA